MKIIAHEITSVWLWRGAMLSVVLLAAGCATDKVVRKQNHQPFALRAVNAANFDPCQANLDEELPIITCQPLDLDQALGKPVTFRVEAKGGGSLTYQWYHAGATNSEFEPVNGGNQRRLHIPAVVKEDYGTYFCVIASEHTANDWPIVTQTRMAELGGRRSRGASGPFAATQYPVANGTTLSICGQPVSGRWVRFPGTQTPDAGLIRFEGRLVNVTSNNIVINRNDYLLQWWYTSSDTGCCTNAAAANNDVAFSPASSSKAYRFIAHFKKTKAPPVGNVIELRGDWLP